MREARIRRLAGVFAVVALGALTTTAAAAGAAVSVDRESTMTLVAMFRDASPTRVGNEVKAAGATVGYIDSIELDHGLARVAMTVESSVLPLHLDATATITEKDLLGERYISLSRGTPSAPELAGNPRVITLEHTRRTVDLQDVLNSQDDPTSTALAALVTTLGQGLDGQGPQVQAGLKALTPALRQADELGRLLSDQNDTLTQLIDSAQPVAGALAAGRGQKLDSFINSTTRLLSTVADDRDATAETLHELPGALRATQQTLEQVANASNSMSPTLARLRPITDNLVDISGELERFSNSADPALSSLRPVLDHGKSMLDELGPVAHDLHTTGSRVRTLAAAGRHISDDFLSGRRLDDLMEFVRNWALVTNGYDGLSHYFRAAVVASPKALATTGLGPIPGAPQGQNIPSPFLPGLMAPPPVGPRNRPFEPGQDGGITGLNRQQEHDMFHQLIGGR